MEYNNIFTASGYKNIYTMDNYKFILLSCFTLAMLVIGSIIGISYSDRYVKVYIVYNVIMLLILIHSFVKYQILHVTLYGTNALLHTSNISIIELIYKFVTKQLWYTINMSNFKNVYLNDILIKLILNNDMATISTIPLADNSTITIDKIEEYKKDPRLLLTSSCFISRSTSFATIPSAHSFDIPDDVH